MPPRPTAGVDSVYESVLPASVSWTKSPENSDEITPLARHLKDGFEADKPHAWHRNEERGARQLPAVHDLATDLEDWERDLAWTEILLLSGGPRESLAHLARAWGRDDGFHVVLSQLKESTAEESSYDE